MFDPAELFKICDDDCMVVQFVQEDGEPTGVGFNAWVPDYGAHKDNLEELLNRELSVWWPKDLDGRMPDAKRLKRKLKAERESWVLTVVKILAFGGRIEMTAQSKNMEKFGVLVADKHSRHQYKRKRESSTSSSSSSDDDSKAEDKKKKRTQLNGKKKQTSRGPGQANSQILETIAQKIPTQDSNLFDESDSDEDLAKTKDGLIDQVRILQHQLQEQKKENSRLRKLIRCSEKIPELEGIVKNLENRLKEMAGDTYRSRSSHSKHHHQSSSKSSTSTQSSNHGGKSSSTTSTSHHQFSNGQQGKSSSNVLSTFKSNGVAKSKQHQVLVGASGHKEQHQHQQEQEGEQQDIIDPSADSIHDEPGDEEGFSAEDNSNSTKPSVRFGERSIAAEKLSLIPLSKGYSKYVCALCKALFSDQELQTCTLTGAPSNFTKKQQSEEPYRKKQLPQDVVKDIIEHVMAKFAGVTQAAIEKSIRIKCNNEAGKVTKQQNNKQC